MNYDEIKTLKNKVEFILKTHPETRDSDAELTQFVCSEFGGDPISLAPSIGRCRRKFNESGLYLTRLEKVAIQRGMSVEEWRVAMGYPTTQGSFTPPSRDVDKPVNKQKQLFSTAKSY